MIRKGCVLLIWFFLMGIADVTASDKVSGKKATSPPVVPGTRIIMKQEDMPRWKSKWDLARKFTRQKKYDVALILYREVLEIKPTLDDARFEMAQILRYVGKDTEAIEALEIFLESKPDRTDAMLPLAELLAAHGNEKRALKLYEQILLKEPSNLAALTGLGEIYFRLKGYSEAFNYLSKALSRNPGDANLIYMIAACLDNLGKFDEAVTYYQKLLGSRGSDPVFVHRYVDSLVNAGREAAAISMLSGFLKNYPDNLAGHEKITQLYLKKEKNKEALPHLKEMLGKNRSDGKLLFKIGQIESELGLYKDAAASLQALLKIEPKHKEGMLALVQALSASGQYPAAIEQYKAYLSLAPKDEEAWKGLAGMYLKTKQYPEAAAIYEKLSQEYPKKTGFKFDLADVWLKMGEQEKVLRPLEDVLSLEPNNKDALVKKATILQTLGRPDEATQVWQTVVETYPDLSPAKLALAHLLIGQARVAAAQNLFCSVLADDAKNLEASKGLAKTHETRGELDLTLDTYKKILAAYPDDKDAKFGLARTYEGVKDYEEAGKWYTRLLAENPNSREAFLGLARLARLSGNYRKSQTTYSDILSQYPELEAARTGLAELYIDEGRADYAWAEYQKMILKDPGSAAGGRGLVLLHLRDNEDKEAENLLRSYLASHSGSDGDRLLLARILTGRKKWDEAAGIYQPMFNRGEVAGEARIGLAELYYRSKQFPQAVAVCNAVLQEMPYSVLALIRLRKSLVEAGDGIYFETIDMEIDRLCQRRPDVFWNDDFLKDELLDWPEKVALYQRIKENNPEHFLAGWFLARALEYVDVDKALKEYEDWVEKYPDNEGGLLKLARLYARKFAFSKALARYDKLLAIDPANTLYQYEKIDLFFKWGRGDEALVLLKTLLIPPVDDVIEEKLKQIAENAEDQEIKDKLLRFLSKRSKGSVYQFYEKISREIKKKMFPEKLLPMMERIRLDLYGDYLIQKRAHDKGGIFSIIPRR